MQQDTEQERRAVVSAGEGLIPTHLVDALAEGRAHDPFSLLGPHMAGRRVQIRTWQPGRTVPTVPNRIAAGQLQLTTGAVSVRP